MVGDNKGSETGLPAQPPAMLFTIYVADIDEMLKKTQPGGNVVGREKVWSLPFAKSEKEMKEKMRSLGKYVRKTKMMVFNKRKGKSEGRTIEQVSHGQGTHERDSDEGK
jgi:hypothetical protein